MVKEIEIPEGYQVTEMGILPKDWVIKPIGDFVTIYVSGDLKKEKFATYQDENFKYPVFSNTVSNSGLYGYYNFPEYNGDSLTIVGRGVGLGTAFQRSGGYGAIGRLLVLFPNKYADSRFITEYINNRVKIFFESGGIPQLTGISFSKYRIPLPPSIEEQTAIATTLSDTDALIENLEKLITKKRNIKQGVMQELLKPKNDWIEKVLGETAILKARIGWQGLTTAEYKTSGDFYLITGTEFRNGFIDWDNCFYIDEERYKQDKNIQVKQQDILVTKDGTIGKVALIKSVPIPATLNRVW